MKSKHSRLWLAGLSLAPLGLFAACEGGDDDFGGGGGSVGGGGSSVSTLLVGISFSCAAFDSLFDVFVSNSYIGQETPGGGQVSTTVPPSSTVTVGLQGVNSGSFFSSSPFTSASAGSSLSTNFGCSSPLLSGIDDQQLMTQSAVLRIGPGRPLQEIQAALDAAPTGADLVLLVDPGQYASFQIAPERYEAHTLAVLALQPGSVHVDAHAAPTQIAASVSSGRIVFEGLTFGDAHSQGSALVVEGQGGAELLLDGVELYAQQAPALVVDSNVVLRAHETHAFGNEAWPDTESGEWVVGGGARVIASRSSAAQVALAGASQLASAECAFAQTSVEPGSSSTLFSASAIQLEAPAFQSWGSGGLHDFLLYGAPGTSWALYSADSLGADAEAQACLLGEGRELLASGLFDAQGQARVTVGQVALPDMGRAAWYQLEHLDGSGGSAAWSAVELSVALP